MQIDQINEFINRGYAAALLLTLVLLVAFAIFRKDFQKR